VLGLLATSEELALTKIFFLERVLCFQITRSRIAEKKNGRATLFVTYPLFCFPVMISTLHNAVPTEVALWRSAGLAAARDHFSALFGAQ